MPTTDTSAFNQTYWAAQATGTPNNISLYDPGWDSTPGVVINFVAAANNTGPVTITILPSNTVIPLQVDTSLGPIPLSGGEIVQHNTPRIIFDSIANIFHLTNPASSGGGGGGTGVPIGTEVSCPGFNPPAGFVFENGQLLSRTGATATLFSQLTLTQAGVTTSGSKIVSSLTDTSQFSVGNAIEGSGIPAATTISSVDSGTQIHISANATASGTVNLTVFAYGNGDGSTTFGIPDRRGRLLVGRDNMGGTAAGVLTSTYTTNSPDALGNNLSSPAAGGGGSVVIAQGYLPAAALGVSIPGGQGAHQHSVVVTTGPGGGGQAAPGNGAFFTNEGTSVATLPAMSGSTNNMGSGIPISPINPGQTTNWCLRVQ